MKNNKSLGQHWLKNRQILDEIADLAVVDGVDTCVEIGPGLGTLTSSLLKRFASVTAIEFDPTLAHNLPNSFPGKNLEVIRADILQWLEQDFSAWHHNKSQRDPSFRYVAVGNVPYYITSPIVNRLLAARPMPAKIVLLIQKEVAERIAAEPGAYNLLALAVQNVAEVELGPVVRAAEFTPPPKVDSQVIVISPLSEPQIDPVCLGLAKKGFSSPRKKLAGVLADGVISRERWREILTDQGINPDCRAQDLSLWDWENLFQATAQNVL